MIDGKNFTYVAQRDGADFVKIGISEIPYVRLFDYKAGDHTFEMIYLIEGNLEKEFAENFADNRIYLEGSKKPTEQYFITNDLRSYWESYPNVLDRYFYGYPQDWDAKFIEMYNNGDRSVDIKKECGIRKTDPYKYKAAILRNNLKRNERKIRSKTRRKNIRSKLDVERIIELYKGEEKRSIKFLVKEFNTSQRTIESILDDNGIPRRNESEQRKLNIERGRSGNQTLETNALWADWYTICEKHYKYCISLRNIALQYGGPNRRTLIKRIIDKYKQDYIEIVKDRQSIRDENYEIHNTIDAEQDTLL